MDDRKNVLVLCTRNTARSQMAEAVLRKLAGDRFNVYSAGLRPDQIHPMVEPIMNEIGIDVSGHYSKDVGEYLGTLAVHHLIIVCYQVEQHCPRLFPGALQRHFEQRIQPGA
jgi:arsenate reductase